MYNEWEEAFDAICGAALRDTHTEPLVDSSIRDWVHGALDASPAGNALPEVKIAAVDDSANLGPSQRDTYLLH